MVKLVIWTVGGLILLIALVVGGAFGYRAYRQSEASAKLVVAVPPGIDERLFIPAGGIEQWITIRGEDRANPIILFVHGGPSEAHSYFPAVYRVWEKDFTIVQWDQRGAGRTFGANPKPPADLNLKRMTQDGIEVAEWVTRHLGQSKVILVGHSWGSILGEHMAFARPDLFSAYVGTGQFVGWDRMAQAQYAYSLERAKTAGDQKTLAKLQEIGPPPYADIDKYLAFRQASRGDIAKADADFIRQMTSLMLLGPRVTLADMRNAQQGAGATFAALGPTLMQADLPALGYDFPVPLFVIQGADDHITPTDLARDYFEHIRAPSKAMVVIDGAGHFAAMTHTQQFLDVLNTRVRPAALAAASP